LCRRRPQPDFALIQPCLPMLSLLLTHPDKDILSDACWSISYIGIDSSIDNHKIQSVIASGCVPHLVRLLGNEHTSVKTAALRAIGNIVTGDDRQTQVCVSYGVIEKLIPLLSHSKKSLRKESCWTLSNITAGTSDQVEEVIQYNAIPALVKILRSDDNDIQKEAAWAISNATENATDSQIKRIAISGVIPALTEMLQSKDPKIVLVILEAIDNILKVGKADAISNPDYITNEYAVIFDQAGGIDYLECLQSHENTDIYTKSIYILQEYFQADEVCYTEDAHSNESMFQQGFNIEQQQQQQQPINTFQF